METFYYSLFWEWEKNPRLQADALAKVLRFYLIPLSIKYLCELLRKVCTFQRIFTLPIDKYILFIVSLYQAIQLTRRRVSEDNTKTLKTMNPYEKVACAMLEDMCSQHGKSDMHEYIISVWTNPDYKEDAPSSILSEKKNWYSSILSTALFLSKAIVEFRRGEQDESTLLRAIAITPMMMAEEMEILIQDDVIMTEPKWK